MSTKFINDGLAPAVSLLVPAVLLDCIIEPKKTFLLRTQLFFQLIATQLLFCLDPFCTKMILPHIFLKAQVASNKNAHKLQHHFWAQFFMLFHMMWSILFRVLAPKTLKWKFLIGCWRTSANEKVVSWPNTPHKMKHTMWKSMKNCAPKWCCKLCAFLFKVTCASWKMCFGKKPYQIHGN